MVLPRIELRQYMLRAHALEMTSGDYQFLYTSAQLVGDSDVSLITSDVLWEQNDGYDEIAREAFGSVLFVRRPTLFSFKVPSFQQEIRK